jgi:ribosomal protein L7/L12
MPSYAVLLQSCPDASRATVAAFLGRLFSLKESTCASIAQSTPIVILTDLTSDEAAACILSLSGLDRLGAVVQLITDPPADLPKIDWPRRPQVFKRDLAEHVADLQLSVAGTPLIALLRTLLPGGAPVPVAPPVGRAGQEFRGIQLPEITPFATPVLPAAATATAPAEPADTLSRLNELFPDDGSFAPTSNQDINSLLNRLLPDEASSRTPTEAVPTSSTSTAVPIQAAPLTLSGHTVFLTKITDEARRQKAVPVIAELARLSPEEADALSKKMIIPVIKGVSKEEADAAKQRFAKIGIIARIKAADAT